MRPNLQLKEPANVLNRVKRGLSGYVSYLAACEMNQSFSEYVLYEPILRILTAQNYSVRCEVECPGLIHSAIGDRKRLDFVASGHQLAFALEVKWAKSSLVNVSNDHRKLAAFLASNQGEEHQAFLCVFGRKSNIEKLVLKPDHFKEFGKGIIAELGITRYGCRIYELRKTA